MAARRSDTIAKLTEALIAAQREFDPAVKTAENPHRKSKYVDLNHAWQACRTALWDHGLTVMQTSEVSSYRVARTNKTGEITEAPEPLLITTLSHTSGEWIEGEYPLRPTVDDPQGLGAALTYARRYALMALVGLAPEDDDGESVSRRDRDRDRDREQRPQRERSNGRRETTAPDPPHDGGDGAAPPRPWFEVSAEIVRDANEEWVRECRARDLEPPKEWRKVLENVHQLNMHLAVAAVERGKIAEPEVKGGKWASTTATQLWQKTPRKVMAAVRVYLTEKFTEAREASVPDALSNESAHVGAPVGERRELPEDGEEVDGWELGRT